MFQPISQNAVYPNLLGIAPGFEGPQAVSVDEFVNDPDIKRLRETHILFPRYNNEWLTYVTAYEGGPEITTETFLHTHSRENEADYRVRVGRAHYLNYCQPLVDFFTNFIFSETIQRDGGSNEAFYLDFVKNVDRKGNGVIDFMREVSDDLQIFGHLYITVDLPTHNLDSKSDLSMQDVEDLGLDKPYWVLIKPTEIIDWTIDDFDNLTYYKRKQRVTEFNGTEKRHYEKYTEVTSKELRITKIDVTDGAKPFILPATVRPNPFNFIPFVIGRYRKSKFNPFMGESFLKDFARNNIEVMNLTSLLQEFLYKQCFNFLAKEADASTIPMQGQIDGNISVANVLEYPRGGTPPSYVTPPVEPAQFLQSEMNRIINEMYKRASQDMVNELFNGEKRSGFSQSQSFAKTVPFISSRADTLEKIENELMALTIKLRDPKGKWDGKIKYKDRYEMTNVNDLLAQLTMVFRDLIFPSQTFLKEELKRVVAEFDGKLPPDKLKTINAEIDSMNFDDWQEKQLEALVGKTNSPAEQQKPKQSGTTAEVAAESSKTSQAATTKKTKPASNSK